MFARRLETRAVARVAVAGLAVGLLTLAGLAAWGTVSAERGTARVRAMNQDSDAWRRVFQHLVLVDEALRDYERASDIGRQPLRSAVAGTEARLRDLEPRTRSAGSAGTAGSAADMDADQIAMVRETFDSHAYEIEELLRLGRRGGQSQVALSVEDIVLGGASLRKQVSANVERKRLQAAEYMDQTDLHNRRLRLAAVAAVVPDLALLIVFSVVLLRYQRRVEHQAASSRHDALHDSLTGLANRILLADRTGLAVRGTDRHADESVGLLLIDLDRFKEVNDTLGHHAGDLLLKHVAGLLRAVVRSGDTVARLGGDEFAVLAPRLAHPDEGLNLARRLLAALRQPVELDGVTVGIGASIGVAVCPRDSGDGAELLKHADIAMYSAKRGGLGAVPYDPSLDEDGLERLTLLGELRRAIDENQLVLHYQPKARLADGQICGVEALVRWQHPSRGLLGPAEFIPLAERSGLIEPLTRSVLAGALEQCSRWRRDGLHLPVAVNVAARSLRDPAFPDEVADQLRRHDVDPGMLTLEITESVVITDTESVLASLSALSTLGVRLSLDDFGTGYSSMSYLLTLPVHELKIDRCFLTPRSDSRNYAIVRAVLELARHLGLDVVAEGIENEETWLMLAGDGCDVGQGFHLSRPLPAAELNRWLAGRPPSTAYRIA